MTQSLHQIALVLLVTHIKQRSCKLLFPSSADTFQCTHSEVNVLLNTLVNKNPATVHTVQCRGCFSLVQVPKSNCMGPLFFFPPHPSPSAPAATPSPLACTLTSSPHFPSLCISMYSVVLVTQSTSTKITWLFLGGGEVEEGGWGCS